MVVSDQGQPSLDFSPLIYYYSSYLAFIVVSLLGSYAIRNRMKDVILSVGFGLLGYILNKAGFNPIPLILGLVLGTMVERNFHRALTIPGGSYPIFFTSPVSKILIVLTILSLISPFISPLLKRAYRSVK